MDTNKIAYIDEDERVTDSYRPLNMHIGENQSGHMNGGGFKNIYTRGNSVREHFMMLKTRFVVRKRGRGRFG
ncbi:unnamed protein product [Wuchereria bancrofti]|uniref:Uncharacterized protein n=1 Tax=Wuchereria bancrofti TaxID=6293 RepID=A0A3P7DZP4_WUCBA|nr:unnamed protein product [Wuchereria bancrofti]